jgi:DNA-binding protein HU-beta
MTYEDLVEAVAHYDDSTKAEAERKLATVFTVIKAKLETSEEISIPKFGKFSVVEVAERQGRNPNDQTPMTIPAHKRVKFKASSKFKVY